MLDAVCEGAHFFFDDKSLVAKLTASDVPLQQPSDKASFMNVTQTSFASARLLKKTVHGRRSPWLLTHALSWLKVRLEAYPAFLWLLLLLGAVAEFRFGLFLLHLFLRLCLVCIFRIIVEILGSCVVRLRRLPDHRRDSRVCSQSHAPHCKGIEGRPQCARVDDGRCHAWVGKRTFCSSFVVRCTLSVQSTLLRIHLIIDRTQHLL